MADIYITGHKNPDLDSVCSAYCYADLKNKLDRENSYVPVRCGNLNRQTKEVFANNNITPPQMMRDVYPKVQDIVRKDTINLECNEPILRAVRLIDDLNVSVFPVFDENLDFHSIISIHEITGFFIRETSGERPDYVFRTDNFERVLPGYFLQQGEEDEFVGPIMTGAMPYETSIKRFESLLPKKPVLIIGYRKDILEYVLTQQLPAIILTGIDSPEEVHVDFSGYRGHIFISETDTAETVRLLRLSTPIKNIADTHPDCLNGEDLFDETKEKLLGSNYRGLPVFTDGTFEGMVTRRCFINKPKKKIILVDHNEISQSIPGAEQAEILEIIDHHRLNPEKTYSPIYVFNKPVGSTCTIIFHHYRINNVAINKKIALLMLSGILSDTVLLKSPTTTDEDVRAAQQLASMANIDYHSYGEKMFSQTVLLRSEPPRKLITTDFKTYEDYGVFFGIGQIEVVTLTEVPELAGKFLAALKDIRKEKGLDWIMLLITNVIKENSMLITTSFRNIEKQLVYKPLQNHLFDLPGVLSRKKQLLPEILRVLEENIE
mgnify:FL=1